MLELAMPSKPWQFIFSLLNLAQNLIFKAFQDQYLSLASNCSKTTSNRPYVTSMKCVCSHLSLIPTRTPNHFVTYLKFHISRSLGNLCPIPPPCHQTSHTTILTSHKWPMKLGQNITFAQNQTDHQIALMTKISKLVHTLTSTCHFPNHEPSDFKTTSNTSHMTYLVHPNPSFPRIMTDLEISLAFASKSKTCIFQTITRKTNQANAMTIQTFYIWPIWTFQIITTIRNEPALILASQITLFPHFDL